MKSTLKVVHKRKLSQLFTNCKCQLALAILAFSGAAFAAGIGVSFSPGGEKGLYLPGETPELTLVVSNRTDKVQNVKLNLRTFDYFGTQVASEVQLIELGAVTAAEKRFSYPGIKGLGFFCTVAEWEADGERGVSEGSFAKVSSPPAMPDPLFGISGYAPAEAVEAYARMGVGTKAVPLNWRRLEGKDSKLDTGKALASIRALKAKGIKVIGHTDVPPRISDTPRHYLKEKYAPKEDPVADLKVFLADYEKFAFELVSAFKGEIRNWSAVNEINLTANMKPYMRQRYIDCVKAFSRGMRRADPSATLVALGCSGADGRNNPRYPFLRGLLPSVVDSIDGFGIDQYNAGQDYGKGYANLNSEQAEIREIMLEAVRIAQANGKHIVSIEEKGPSIVRATPLSSPLGRLMADIVARDYILLKTVPEVGYWLYFRPFNWNPKSVKDYGMWENANPRQVVAAYAGTARLMAGSAFVKRLAVHKDIPAWMFRKDGRFFATVWYNGPSPLEFRLPTREGVSVRDLHGNAIDIRNGVMMLDSSPVYLFAATERALESVIGAATFSVPDIDGAIETAVGGRLALSVRNIGTKPTMAEVPGAGSVSLAAGETKSMMLAADGHDGHVTVKSSSGTALKIAVPEKPYLVKRVGGFDGLAAAEEIILNDPARQSPAYADLKSNGLYAGTDDLSATAKFGYDDNFLYMEFVVRDDVHSNDNLPPRVFAGDCVQFAIDTRKDGCLRRLKGQCGFGDGDYNICAGLADGKPVLWCYSAAAVNRARMVGRQMSVVPEIVRDEAAKTTRYRVNFPFSDLAPLKPEKGAVFGLSFLVFDKDPKEVQYRIEATSGVAGPPDPSAYPAFLFN